MKVGDLLSVRIKTEYIRDQCRHIQRLIAKRMTNSDKSINRKVWREDFEKYIQEIEQELEAIKVIMANNNWLEKDDLTER